MAKDDLIDAFDPSAQAKHEKYLKDGTYQRDSLKRAQAQAMQAAGIVRGGDFEAMDRAGSQKAISELRMRASTPQRIDPLPNRSGSAAPARRTRGLQDYHTISAARPKPAALRAVEDLVIQLQSGGQDLIDTLGGKWAEPATNPTNAGDWIGNLVTSVAKLPGTLALAPITGTATLQKMAGNLVPQSSMLRDMRTRGYGAQAETVNRGMLKEGTADLGGFLLPFSGELSEVAFGDSAKAGQMLKHRALTDPASLALDALGIFGLGRAARRVSRAAPVVARNVVEGVRIARQPARTPVQAQFAMETVQNAARVRTPPAGPLTAKLGIQGIKPPVTKMVAPDTLGNGKNFRRPTIPLTIQRPDALQPEAIPGGDRPGQPTGGDASGPGRESQGAAGNPREAETRGLRTELIAPEDLDILPGMQYKRGVDKSGVTDILKGQKDYEVEHGGTLSAFRDPEGKLFAVDGHHRRELAQRAQRFTAPQADGTRIEVPRQLPVQILDAAQGWTPESAKAFGVLKNLRENKGVAIDAADALMASMTPEQARSETQKLPKMQIARDVSGLVLLNEAGRTAVRNRQIPDAVGAAIGEVLRGDTQRQRIAIEQALNTNGVRSFDDGAALAHAVKEEEIALKQEGDQGSMFGDDESIGGTRFQSTAGEQAMITQSVKRRLQSEQSGLLAVEKTQARAGEQFDIEGRREEASQVKDARSKADALLEFDPEVKGILRQSAADVLNGQISRDEGVKRVREVLLKNGTANLADIVKKGGQPQQPAPSGGGLFGQDSTAKPLPDSSSEPWQIRKSDFIKANAKNISGDDLIGTRLFKRIGRTEGKPGISDEPLYKFEKEYTEGGKYTLKKVPTTIDDIAGEGRNIVYRNDKGHAIAVLQFYIDPDTAEAIGPTVYVTRENRGKGIASKLYKAAQEAGYKVEEASGSTDFTPAGAEFYHARKVANAVSEGKPVPPEVLADYPSLKKKSVPEESQNSTSDIQNSTSDIKTVSNPAVPRIPPAPLSDGKPARAAKEISLGLGRALGRRIDYGAKGRGRNVLGTFFRNSKRTTIKWRGDVDTTAHEVGHLIDDATGLVGDYASARQKSPFDAELVPNFSQFGSGTTGGARGSLAYHRAEGVAEFIRAYLFNPDEARQQAPKFTAHFEAKAKDFLPQLRAFGDDVRRVVALDPVERGMLSVSWDPERKSPAQKLKAALKGDGYDFEVTAWDRFQTRWTDDAHPAIAAAKWLAKQQGQDLRPSADFELLLRTYVGGEATKIRQMIETGIETPAGKKLTGGGLAWVLDPIVGRRKSVDTNVLEGDMKRTALMMIAERTIELSGRDGIDGDRVSGLGYGIFSDVGEARKILQQFQKDAPAYARMQKAATRYREYSRGMLEYMVETGRLSQETMDTITKENQFYVDFSRDLGKEGFGMPGGGLAKGKNPVKRIKGSLDEINNPFTSLMENGFQMIGEADRNRVMRSFRDLVKPDTNPNSVNLSAIADEMPGVYNPATERIEAPRDTVTIFVEGKPEYWRINIPEVKKYLEGLGRDSVPEVAEATIGLFAKTLKFGVTSSPGYIVRNILRDQVERPFKSRVGGTLIDNAKRLPKGTDREFFLSGGGQFGNHVATRQGYDTAMRSAMREIAKDPNAVLAAPGQLVEGYNKLKEKGELVTRLREYSKAKEYAKQTLGYGEEDARLYAAYQARDLMDFAVAGEWARVVNGVVPFFNSKIQGIRRTGIAAKENPKTFAANLAIMGASGAALVGLIKATGEDRLEEYRELPAYRRDLFWCIPVPGSSRWIFIPKGFETAVMASALERAANWAMGDKRAFDGYLTDPNAPIPIMGGTLIQNLFPFEIDELAGPMKSIVGALANYDFFRQKQIVPSFDDNKPLDQRDTSRASRMAQWIERMSQVDARKADYLLGAVGGNLGRTAAQASDIGRADKPLATPGEFALSQTGLVGSAPGTEAISVQTAIRKAREAGMSQNPLKEQFDGLKKATTPSQYDVARRNLVRAAKSPAVDKKVADYDERRRALDTLSGGDKELRGRIGTSAAGMIRREQNNPYRLLETREVLELARLREQVEDKLVAQSGGDPKRARASISRRLSGIPPEALRSLATQHGIR